MSNEIPVDTGQVIVVDPAYLFPHDEWQTVVKTRSQGAMGKAIFAALKKKLGVEFCQGALVGTGGDGTFQAKSSEHGVPITIDLKRTRLLGK